MLERYGRMIHRRARLVLVLAGVAFAAAAVVGVGAFGKLKNGGFDDPATESSRAKQVIETQFGGRANLVLLVHASTGTVDSPQVRAGATALAENLSREPTVADVVTYWQTGSPSMKSADGRDAIITAHVNGDDTQLVQRASYLIDTYAVDGDGISVRAAGDTATNVDVRTEVGRSLAIAEAIAIPLTMLLLVVAFGSLVSALLPLAIGGLAIIGTFAELYVLGSLTDVSVFSINLTTALGLGLAIDYALLLVSRFREQLAAGQGVDAAVSRTVATAGRTILFSGAAVAAALGALLVFPQFFLRSFAYAGIGVVVIAAAGALVVVPALLSVLGARVNRGRIRWLSRAAMQRGPESPMWGRIAAAVMRRPVLAAAPVLAALVLAASPLLGVTFGTPDQGVLPPSATSRHVADTVRSTFPGNDSSAIDIVTTGSVAEAAWSAFGSSVSQLDGVTRVQSATASYVDGHNEPTDPGAAALDAGQGRRLRVVTNVPLKSAAAQALVTTIRAMPGPEGVAVLVGGADAQLVDSKAAIASRLPYALALIVVSTFVLLFLFTGSVVQPLRALVLNAVSLSASLGVMTWIFQEGHLSTVLGFTPRPMDTSMTVLLFCIVFGLSMDYELFLTSRIKELHDRGESLSSAVTTGLARTGRIVSTAAGLLAVSFFAFATSSVSFLQMFGLGSGLAILIDATLVRGVLVPAAMKALGRVAWWAPKPLRRVHAKLALGEA
jgi:putative drug exporter of the RND superfamily